MKKVFNLTSILFLSIVLFSCISQKKFNELQKKCNDESSVLNAKNLDLSNDVTELNAKINKLQQQLESLKNDTASLGLATRTINSSYLNLKSNYELLSETKDKMQAGTNAEMQKLMKDLQAAQTELLKKEDELTLKKQNLDNLNSDLLLKEAKLKDLQNILFKKDSTVNALRKKVSDALFGFENKGLSISKKNGKVYVSLDESLLFASGSTEVAPNGVMALKKLAKVLEDNTDINILIEGHTDNVPYKGTGTMKDNWDLSVIRATTVLKIIVNNSKINPSRLTAAGRSQYMPIENTNTSEARSKNRRTEIILTPKLDELLNILESN